MSSIKTLAIRLDGELHARLAILARLTGISITDAIRTAIEKEVDVMASDSAVAAKATDLQAEIIRDAEEQRAAIQALFGGEVEADSKEAAAPTKPAPRKGTSS